MTNFILVEPVDHVAELLRLVPSFALSREHRSLDDEDRRSAGLVFAAFAKFMEESLGNKSVLEECIRAIEVFATGSDRDAHNLLVTEVFGSFCAPKVSREVLLADSRALYDQWIGS